MSSATPTSSAITGFSPARPVARPASARPAVFSGALSAFVAVVGAVLALVGGGWKPGAFNLYPREDGLFTTGVVAAVAVFAHGLRERTALAVITPILASTAFGIWRGHHRPLALFGAELAIIGVIGVVFERWRARNAKS